VPFPCSSLRSSAPEDPKEKDAARESKLPRGTPLLPFLKALYFLLPVKGKGLPFEEPLPTEGKEKEGLPFEEPLPTEGKEKEGIPFTFFFLLRDSSSISFCLFETPTL